jgi:hypothetical protein
MAISLSLITTNFNLIVNDLDNTPADREIEIVTNDLFRLFNDIGEYKRNNGDWPRDSKLKDYFTFFLPIILTKYREGFSYREGCHQAVRLYLYLADLQARAAQWLEDFLIHKEQTYPQCRRLLLEVRAELSEQRQFRQRLHTNNVNRPEMVALVQSEIDRVELSIKELEQRVNRYERVRVITDELARELGQILADIPEGHRPEYHSPLGRCIGMKNMAIHPGVPMVQQNPDTNTIQTATSSAPPSFAPSNPQSNSRPNHWRSPNRQGSRASRSRS